MKSARTQTETADALEEVQVTPDVLVEHLGLQREVRAALAAKKTKTELARLEIERSLGQEPDIEGDSRR